MTCSVFEAFGAPLCSLLSLKNINTANTPFTECFQNLLFMAKKACVMEFVTASGFKSMFNVLESLHRIHFFQLYLLV